MSPKSLYRGAQIKSKSVAPDVPEAVTAPAHSAVLVILPVNVLSICCYGIRGFLGSVWWRCVWLVGLSLTAHIVFVVANRALARILEEGQGALDPLQLILKTIHLDAFALFHSLRCIILFYCHNITYNKSW